MICVKKLKNIIPIALACIVIIAFFSFGAVISYLTDAETKTNIITIGNVALAVSEPSYQDSSIVAAGDSLTKNPIITNTGTKDEYVFFRVGIPKREVTLLYEEDTTIGEGNEAKKYKEGTPTVNNMQIDSTTGAVTIKANSDEIYRIISEGVKDGAKATDIIDELGSDVREPNKKPQLDFSYNKGNSDNTNENGKTAGWIYLSRELDKKISDDENAPKYDYYYFGYNKRLLPKSTQNNENQNNNTQTDTSSVTIPLFDRIQLKSFIDEEINDGNPTSKKNEETKILIDAYGIQADSLGGDLNNLSDFLDKTTLNKILNIVNGKKG